RNQFEDFKSTTSPSIRSHVVMTRHRTSINEHGHAHELTFGCNSPPAPLDEVVGLGQVHTSRPSVHSRKEPARNPPQALVNGGDGITSASVAFIAGASSCEPPR